MMETQISMYALHRATNAEWKSPILFVISISFLSACQSFLVAHGEYSSLQKTHKEAVGKIEEFMKQQENWDDQEGISDGNVCTHDFATRTERCKAWLWGLPGPDTLPKRQGVLKMARSSKIAIVMRMRLGLFTLMLIIVHSFVKLVMAAYVCPHGFWNIPVNSTSLQSFGCADLTGIGGIRETREKHVSMSASAPTSAPVFVGGVWIS